MKLSRADLRKVPHRELRLHPLLVDVTPEATPADREGQWVSVSLLGSVGLPAPLRQLLEQLRA